MPLLMRKNRWIAWIASFAILLGALAPTVSRWLAASHQVALPMMEVCVSRVGAPSILVLKSIPGDSSTKMKMDHCPLCVMHADGLGLPPDRLDMPILNTLSDAMPPLFLNAPSPLHVWAAALARAPPASLA